MRAAELHRLIENLVRLGTIAEVDHASARVRVRSGELLTAWLPWQTPRAGTTRDWDPPSVGEQAILLSPGGDPAAGVVITGLFSTACPAPSSSATLCRRDYPDGTRVDYDHGGGVLTVDCVGDVIVKGARTLTVDHDGDVLVKTPTRVTVDAPESTFKGKLTVEGKLTYLSGLAGSTSGSGAAATIQGGIEIENGDLTADGVSVKHHRHSGDSGGTTGEPN
jgi:phage baseplate assembly protein V